MASLRGVSVSTCVWSFAWALSSALSFEFADGRAFGRGRSMGSQVSCEQVNEGSEVGAGLSGLVGNVSPLGTVEGLGCSVEVKPLVSQVLKEACDEN